MTDNVCELAPIALIRESAIVHVARSALLLFLIERNRHSLTERTGENRRLPVASLIAPPCRPGTGYRHREAKVTKFDVPKVPNDVLIRTIAHVCGGVEREGLIISLPADLLGFLVERLDADDQQVGGLQVPVDYLFRMEIFEALHTRVLEQCKVYLDFEFAVCGHSGTHVRVSGFDDNLL